METVWWQAPSWMKTCETINLFGNDWFRTKKIFTTPTLLPNWILKPTRQTCSSGMLWWGKDAVLVVQRHKQNHLIIFQNLISRAKAVEHRFQNHGKQVTGGILPDVTNNEHIPETTKPRLQMQIKKKSGFEKYNGNKTQKHRCKHVSLSAVHIYLVPFWHHGALRKIAEMTRMTAKTMIVTYNLSNTAAHPISKTHNKTKQFFWKRNCRD